MDEPLTCTSADGLLFPLHSRLLDVIQLTDEPPIMVHSLLRPFDNPPLRTYGEFVTFFAQICEVCHLP